MNASVRFVYLPICLSLLMASYSNAQLNLNDRNHGNVGAKLKHKRMRLCFGLNVGIGIPENDFNKTDTSAQPLASSTVERGRKNDTNHLNGFAKSGFHFNIYGQYMLTRILGLKIMIAGTMNSYNINVFNTDYSEIWQKEYGANAIPPVYAAKSGFYTGQYMIGPCFRLRLSSRVKFEGHLLGGLVTVNYPELTSNNSATGKIRIDTGTYSFTQVGSYSMSIASTSVLSVNAAAGIEWLLTPLIGLHADINYLGANLRYLNYNIAYDYLLTTSGQTTTLYQNNTYNIPKSMNIGLLQFTLGGSIDL